jgi:hypothetical protein
VRRVNVGPFLENETGFSWKRNRFFLEKKLSFLTCDSGFVSKKSRFRLEKNVVSTENCWFQKNKKVLFSSEICGFTGRIETTPPRGLVSRGAAKPRWFHFFSEFLSRETTRVSVETFVARASTPERAAQSRAAGAAHVACKNKNQTIPVRTLTRECPARQIALGSWKICTTRGNAS